jgi:acetylcholinesterase/cholinesterase
MVVIVTLNYRLGALGGLATAAGPRGNFQLQDQRLAMTWVRDNIANFGGDPSRVCLFGQSAGGWSVGTHLSSPKSWGLFASAIMMSNPTGLPSEDPKHLYQLSDQVVAFVNCSGSSELTCLRTKTWQQILEAQVRSKPPALPWEMLDLFMPWTPMVDGDELPVAPLTASQTGAFSKVPIMLGSVANDTLMFIFEAFTTPVPKVEYLLAIEAIFGPKYGTEILKLYGPPPDNQTHDGDVRPFLSTLANDYIFYCSNRYFASGYSKSTPTYKYVFEHLPSYEQFFEHDWYPECDNYTCHGSELPMLFNTIYMVPEPDVPTLTENEVVLSAQMQTIFANFAKSGDPNKPSAIPLRTGQPPVVVPRFSNVTSLDLRLDIPTSTFDHHRSKFCEYFDSIGYERR